MASSGVVLRTQGAAVGDTRFAVVVVIVAVRSNSTVRDVVDDADEWELPLEGNRGLLEDWLRASSVWHDLSPRNDRPSQC